ncbi:hypothetical protein QYE76_043616 [Lolium multiflorum]|uniref:DUF4283 domain-containing protein n=1 Tax=Lolium multiflorum TaxID=4521 RepID=A0AAD8TJ16_LOLMU|nr:hypothetical protein QYE76_043616 [Lolium multiflorum]
MNNGPWQFDFAAVLLKNYAGSVRPSDMIFDSMDIWIRVPDLPMDMMNKLYGRLIGNWVGKYISVDVDQDGIAWGKDLRIRVEIRVDQPLPRGVSMKERDDDVEGTWFDIKYERVPHFCFDCGCIVHPEEGCAVEKSDIKQWGEWLRASPRKSQKQPAPARPSYSSGSFCNYSTGSESRGWGGVTIRDIPPRRNLMRDETYSGSSRTGGYEASSDKVASASLDNQEANMADRDLRGKEGGVGEGRPRVGTFTRRTRSAQAALAPAASRAQEIAPNHAPQGVGGRKRGSKQIWVPIPVQVVGDDGLSNDGKRQRKNSVFDRMEVENTRDVTVEPVGSVFNRLEAPARGGGEGQSSSVFQRLDTQSADPAARGRRNQ